MTDFVQANRKCVGSSNCLYVDTNNRRVKDYLRGLHIPNHNINSMDLSYFCRRPIRYLVSGPGAYFQLLPILSMRRDRGKSQENMEQCVRVYNVIVKEKKCGDLIWPGSVITDGVHMF